MRKALLVGLALSLACIAPASAQTGKGEAKKAAPAAAKPLYAAVRRYEGVTDIKEAARRVNEGFVPLISSTPGFVAYYLVDAGGGVMVSTSVFTSQASADESTKKAADWVKKNIAAMVPNPPQVTAGAVIAHKSK